MELPSMVSIRRSIVTFLDGTQEITWPAFREKYLAYSFGAKARQTWERDKAAISALEKFFQPRHLSDINAEMLEGWKSFRRSHGMKAPTINRDLSAVKAMLAKGLSWGYVVQRGWRDVKRIKCAKGRLLFYTIQDLNQILKACEITIPLKVHHHDGKPYPWKTIALLGAQAGLRRSEIYWLSWDDIDFERNIISIIPKEGWMPKDYDQRHIPMTDCLRDHLLKLPRGKWVLSPRPSLDVMTTYFRRIVKNAGLKGGIHTLRHTFASHLAQAGVPLYEISKLLGHASITTTEIYAHLCPSNLKSAIEKLPDLK